MNDSATPPQPASPADAGGAYRVLARKHRPQTFDQLIGQDAMVRTLANAFRTGRIAQAYMLTGVRGVGKTTTARILARALNYKTDAVDAPTIDMPVLGEHCAAIMESHHPDVLEIDAASHTGVDNIREIIDGVRYRPVYARYKVYIIDEVHMLSRHAFNALLKTLEEPPEHVKFVFATTEVRKVPVTVLSRCQRFDLRRVDIETLADHFRAVAAAETVAVEDEALLLIARAAEGSVRDGLSLLDQAIAHSRGTVRAADVRAMLGLAERTRIFELLETALKGDAAGALGLLAALHDDGAEPAQILADLAEAVHVVTRIKVVGATAGDPALSEAEREHASSLADGLSMPLLARAWQMLLKGLAEAREAPRPQAAAEMLLVRLCYAADLPTPGDLIRRMAGDSAPEDAAGPPSTSRAGGGDRGGATRTSAVARSVLSDPTPDRPPEPTPAPATPPQPCSLQEVVDLLEQAGEAKLRHALEYRARLVRFRPGHVELNLLDGAGRGLPSALGEALTRLTGRRWMVAVSDEPGEPPLAESRRMREDEERRQAAAHPAVQALLAQFPGAEITDVRPLAAKPDAASIDAADDEE